MKGPEYFESRRKKALEKSLSLGVMACALPVAAYMWIENKLHKYPLFFKQDRIGQEGNIFTLWKFETLYPGAELDPLHEGLFHTPTEERSDSRVLNARMRFMRKSGLNELAQIVNIFKGEMSVLGPRPQTPDYIKAAEELFPTEVKMWADAALSVRPGLVGTNPLRTRDLPVEDFPVTAKSDIEYIRNASLSRDLRVFGQALQGLLRIKGRNF